jgi:outer membrane protein assembly factor BamB
MDIRWALVDGDRLYVSHAHPTYAASSRGVNAYITALRIPDGAMLWRSQPLVHNGHNFALVPTSTDPATNRPVLITGYGFTAEADWMYVLDAENGAVLNKTKVLSGPEYIVPQGEIVYVRAYNRDYAFRLQL